jgi:lysozyme family protein
MPIGVELCFFDMDVNSGPAEAAKLLQRALNVAADGHIGLITLAAIKATNPIKLIGSFADERRGFYKSLKTYKYFGAGWLSRVATIEAVAYKMAAEVT